MPPAHVNRTPDCERLAAAANPIKTLPQTEKYSLSMQCEAAEVSGYFQACTSVSASHGGGRYPIPV